MELLYLTITYIILINCIYFHHLKFKNWLRNFQPENSQKFKNKPSWPEKRGSYKKIKCKQWWMGPEKERATKRADKQTSSGLCVNFISFLPIVLRPSAWGLANSTMVNGGCVKEEKGLLLLRAGKKLVQISSDKTNKATTRRNGRYNTLNARWQNGRAVHSGLKLYEIDAFNL